MAILQQSELVEFHEFLGKHVLGPQPHRTPEDLLAEWRIQRGDVDECESDVEAIRAALEDLDNGDQGTGAREFIRELDAELARRAAQ